MIQIRTATENDTEELNNLFVETITTINAKDYNKDQIDAWAAAASNDDLFLKKIKSQFFYIAEVQKAIAGFASLDATGYFDLLYVHKDHQRKGVATELLNTILQKAKSLYLPSIWVASSITAKPFFEHHGFILINEQEAVVRNIPMVNYKMIKQLDQF